MKKKGKPINKTRALLHEKGAFKEILGVAIYHAKHDLWEVAGHVRPT